MKKSKIYILTAIFLLIIVTISGCIDKTESIDPKNTPAITAVPKSGESLPMTEEQIKGFSEPTFAMIGFVTYQASGVMSNGPEYSIDLMIQSVTSHSVTFNKIEAKYYDQGPPKTIETSIYPATLEYGQAVRPTIETAYLQEMQNNVENAGKKTIVLYIQLMNDGEKVGGEYSASLPPLSYMQTLGTSHQIDFALDNMPLYK